jgi:hypothetical protein
MILLPGLLPAPSHLPIWAVFADEDGNPHFEPVICYGIFEIGTDGGNTRRLVSAFTQGEHIESADFKPNFVALTRSVDLGSDTIEPSKWFTLCQAKRAEINEAAAKQKIIVPNSQIVPGKFQN